jgi:hypothetical protein
MTTDDNQGTPRGATVLLELILVLGVVLAIVLLARAVMGS